jgi:hypothetical protein
VPPRGPLGLPDPNNQPAPPVGPLAGSATGSTHPAPPVGPLAVTHDRHDLLLIAAHATGDLDAAARAAASELVAGCSACAELAADLRALATATATLPTPPRPRDFRLTPADAERLRPRGLRRFLAALAAPGAFTRPLATGLTTLGVAGLLLASLPGIVPLGMGGAAAPADRPTGQSVAPLHGSPAPSAESGAPQAPGGRDTTGEAPGQEPGTTGGESYEQGPGESDDGGVATDAGDDPVDELSLSEDGAPSVLLVLSGSFLITGLGLFALRWTGRRLGTG